MARQISCVAMLDAVTLEYRAGDGKYVHSETFVIISVSSADARETRHRDAFNYYRSVTSSRDIIVLEIYRY